MCTGQQQGTQTKITRTWLFLTRFLVAKTAHGEMYCAGIKKDVVEEGLIDMEDIVNVLGE